MEDSEGINEIYGPTTQHIPQDCSVFLTQLNHVIQWNRKLDRQSNLHTKHNRVFAKPLGFSQGQGFLQNHSFDRVPSQK